MPTDVKETAAEPKKLNSSVILPDNAATRGQIRLINHMVKVEELN